MHLRGLKAVRERQFLTQDDLSRLTGIATPTLSRLENGIQEPRFSTIHKLAAALRVKPQELVGKPELVEVAS